MPDRFSPETWVRLRCAAYARQRFADDVPRELAPLSDAFFAHPDAGSSDARALLENLEGTGLEEWLDGMVELRDQAIGAETWLDAEEEHAREWALITHLDSVEPMDGAAATAFLCAQLAAAAQSFDLVEDDEIHWQWWAIRHEMEVVRPEDPVPLWRIEVAALLRFARTLGLPEAEAMWRRLASAWKNDQLPAPYRFVTLRGVRGKDWLGPVIRQAQGWQGLDKTKATHKALIDRDVPRQAILTGLAQVLGTLDAYAIEPDAVRALATDLAATYATPRGRFLLDADDRAALELLETLPDEVSASVIKALQRTARHLVLPEPLAGWAGHPPAPARRDEPVVDGLWGGHWLTPLVRATEEHQLSTVRSDLPDIAKLKTVAGHDRGDVAVGVVQLAAWASRDDADDVLIRAAQVAQSAITATFKSVYGTVVFAPDQLDALDTLLAHDPPLGSPLQAWLQAQLSLTERMTGNVPTTLTPYRLPMHLGYSARDNIRNRRPRYPHPAAADESRSPTAMEAFRLWSLRRRRESG